MSDENPQDEQLRERIADFFRAEDEGQQTPVPPPEVEALVTARDKLEQMLADRLAEEQARRETARAQEVRSLEEAAGKLEQMLRGAHRKGGRERLHKPPSG